LDSNMENSRNNRVPAEEIAIQYKYMEQIKELNQEHVVKYGGQKLAYLQSFGCQMNENDSEKLSGMLEIMGYTHTDKLEDSDLVIYNTCCVRENAELKVYGHLGSLKALKSSKPDMIIAVCGCMMQQKDVVGHIKEKYRQVDLIFGTHNLHKFPELLNKAIESDSTIAEVEGSEGSIAEGVPVRRGEGVKAWLTIMYGCNNFCSYCIVPYVRGRERSRQISDIVDEARLLGHQGFKEITLLGQNVNSYGLDLKEDSSFADLLRSLDDVEGIDRIRFMTSHPKDLSEDLILAMRDCKKVCEHLHLPVQAGSNTILNEMNRKYTREYYFDLAGKIRSQIPDISLTTDIIVGYPGESDEDFEQTLDLIEKVRFDYVYTFLYSKRSGTPAANKEDQVSEKTKKERFNALLELQNRIGKELNEPLTGKTVEVLVEGPSKNSITMLAGRTRTNKIVNFKGNLDLSGRLVNVRITNTGTWSLDGILE
jgi:tRNA-2-methylthio-N6-dimethylallyladenosine synthase